MKTLILRCALPRCNIDGSKELNIDKCILQHSTPCYHLIVKDGEDFEPEDAWRKFGDFVSKKSTAK